MQALTAQKMQMQKSKNWELVEMLMLHMNLVVIKMIAPFVEDLILKNHLKKNNKNSILVTIKKNIKQLKEKIIRLITILTVN